MWLAAAAHVRRLDAPLPRPAADAASTCSRSAAHGFDGGRAVRDADALRLPQPGGGRRPAAVAGGGRLSLHSVHAPIGESFDGRPLGRAADAGERRRGRAARRRWTRPSGRCTSRGGSRSGVLVVHLGVPRTRRPPAAEQQPRRGAAQHRGAAAAGRAARRAGRGGSDPERAVAGRLARALRRGGARRRPTVGICLDFGHAHMDGDLVDAIETVSRAPDRDARARQPRADRRSSACRSRARSTGRRR